VVGEHDTVGAAAYRVGGHRGDPFGAGHSERGAHHVAHVRHMVGRDQPDRLVQRVEQQHRLRVQMDDDVGVGPGPVGLQVESQLRGRRRSGMICSVAGERSVDSVEDGPVGDPDAGED
jgi:hypothetical protein